MKTSGPRRRNVSEVLTALLLTTALGWSYASSFVWLVQQWNRDPNHSYGYFVIPIALAILWDRRFLLDGTRLEPRSWGVLLVLARFALRVLLYERNEQYIETATIPLVLGAIALALGG